MKKSIVSLVLITLILSCFFSACGTEKSMDASANEQSAVESRETAEYTLAPLAAFPLGEYDNIAKAEDVFYLWSYEQTNPHRDEDPARTAKIEFCGITYRGSYQYSAVTEGNLYISDMYGGPKGWFSINRDTGEIDGVYPKKTDAIDNPDPAGYKSLAEEIAGQFIPIEEYTLSVEDIGEGIRAFHYFRVIEGMTVWDGLDIVIDSGQITSFERHMTEEFPEGLNRIGEGRVQAFVEAVQSGSALDAIEKTVSESGRKAKFNKESVNLVLLPEDQIGALYNGRLEIEFHAQEVEDPSYISLRTVYLVTEEGTVSLDYESDVNKKEYVDKITLVDSYHANNSRLIEGEAAHLVQDIVRPLPYGDVLYDCSMPYKIIIGDTWYSLDWDGTMTHDGRGLYHLSSEMNEAMQTLLSLSSEYDEGEYIDTISVIDSESPDYPISIEGDYARSMQRIILYLPYGTEQNDHTARYKIIVGDTWFNYEPEPGWLDNEGKGEYKLPQYFNDVLQGIISVNKR